MWSLFPELIGPMLIAFVLGTIVAWVLVAIVLRKHPSERSSDQQHGFRGP